LAEFDDSAGFINTKRFVCRIVDKLHCKVIDEPSFDAFVPYWSSLTSHETYAHLEEELMNLCHAADKWVIPVEDEPITAPVSIPVPAVPVPLPAPAESQDQPCARDPDIQKDARGDSATLDEAGYHGLAELSSPSNMKRFVCRVADKIFCKAVDEASLELFVPYYSSLDRHETYEHLEQELLEICHGDGKWLVPLYSPSSSTAVPVSPLEDTAHLHLLGDTLQGVPGVHGVPGVPGVRAEPSVQRDR
jgi:hypothetical protein